MPASRPGPLSLFRTSRAGQILTPILAGLAHAILMTAAFPPFNLWPCVVLAPIPLVLISIQPSRAAVPRSAWQLIGAALLLALLVAIGAVPFDLYEQQWVMDVSGLGYIPMAFGMSSFTGLFVACLRLCRLRLTWLPMSIAAPIIWTGLEVLRGEIAFTGYPWYLLAHPLIDCRMCAAAASIIGTYGVSFLVAILAGLVGDLTVQPRRWLAPVVMCIVAAAVFIGALGQAPAPPSGEHLRIAVVQTNLPQDNKMGWPWEERIKDFRRFLDLTQRAAATKPDLIAWPETMFPGAFLDPGAIAAVHKAEREFGRPFPGLSDFYDAILAFQKDIGVPMLVGGVGVDNARLVRTDNPDFPFRPDVDASYNSVFLLAGGQVQAERYDKIGLTPFGEVMPYISLWPWLQKQLLELGAHGMTFDLTAGHRPQGFRIAPAGQPPIAVVTPICFEATKPGLCRWLINSQGPGPKLIVNLTNDGWFGSFDPGRWQHLQVARWRAAELGVPVVRAANTGVSAVIDAQGRLVKAGVDGDPRPARVDGVLTADLVPGPGVTIYARFGDVLGWSSLVATAGLILVSLRRPIWGRRTPVASPAPVAHTPETR